MEHLAVLRLYFAASEVRRPDTWWKRLTPQTLGEFLLKQAKEHGIEQALLHRVIGGFLKGQDLQMNSGEIPPPRLPQCLELVGEEDILNAFLTHNREHLTRVRTVFLHGMEAKIEAAIDREEIETSLEMERPEANESTGAED